MVVKANEKQLSFLFQEADYYFEMGDMILQKAHLEYMLPCKKIEQNKKVKIVFQLNNLIPMSKILLSLEQNDIIDILYTMIFMIEKVEENGFLKKECIWLKYEHIYYDIANNKPMFALLPISNEFRYPDGMDWNKRFLTAITHTAEFLPPEKFNAIVEAVKLMLNKQISCENVLEIINGFGSGFSEKRVGRISKKAEKKLILERYPGEEKVSFELAEDEFVIGSDTAMQNGVTSVFDDLSQKHCRIIRQDNIFFVQHLDSEQSTFLNGECIPKSELAQLNHGDILTLANVEFRVYISE